MRREAQKSRRTEDAVKNRLRSLDRFQICLAICRTSSASVRHENTYKDPNSKHCYVNVINHRSSRDLILINNNNGDPVVVTSSTVRLFTLHYSTSKSLSNNLKKSFELYCYCYYFFLVSIDFLTIIIDFVKID